jgi:hypothetical protein
VDTEEESMADREIFTQSLGWSPGKTRLERGVCGTCCVDRPLRADGTMKAHQRDGARCPGTGTNPVKRTSNQLLANRERAVTR